ncbi:class I SAM-dependent methyltransferase [Nonomuraea turcica]|uniref:class I SAM-dependent methyltransferase n=1 Tax=Nonomuraea sp. G32 TaxID=3067274 RepID=UPI00273CE898|nr:class I SAM-dependent methyltransferase [Nonomuraea sp. G32]MDP4510159.1 class I SAM-dependent methyltransferase [Nonomuraea sp. G32]
MRTLKDLDVAAIVLREVWLKIRSVAEILDGDIAREPDEDFQQELLDRYATIRRFLPKLLKHLNFDAGADHMLKKSTGMHATYGPTDTALSERRNCYQPLPIVTQCRSKLRCETGLFTGTSAFYTRFRPGYLKVFFDDVIQRFGLDGSGRLLDLGCGTGQLTIPLADHVAEATGMDPEPDMLTEAAQHALAAKVGVVVIFRRDFSIGAEPQVSGVRLGWSSRVW